MDCLRTHIRAFAYNRLSDSEYPEPEALRSHIGKHANPQRTSRMQGSIMHTWIVVAAAELMSRIVR